jgi:membrane fusion protein (multidrug efflux system)
VKKGADVAFRVAAYGDSVFSGKVSHIAGAVRETRDLMVEAAVPNPDKRLLPGMFADIELTIGTKPMPAVPVSAVFEQNGKKNVFVVVEGHLEQRVLQPRPALEGLVPVVRGVAVGERVVRTHSPELSNGQTVN